MAIDWPNFGDNPYDVPLLTGLLELESTRVPRFTSTGDRDAAIPTPDDGQLCWVVGAGGLFVGQDGAWTLPFVNVRWFGAVGDGVADDTTAIQAAINAAGATGVVVFPAPSSFYQISDALTVPSDTRLIGSGLGCEIRQMTNLKPVFDLFNADNCVVSGFTLTLGPGPSATVGTSFRGDSGYAYCAGVWTNGNRNLIEKLRVKDFSMGVYLNGSDGVINADGDQRVGNVVRDLEVSGANHGVLFLTQTGLRISGLYYHDGVDSSAGVNPIHAIYGTGTYTLTSNDVTISDCVTVNCAPGCAYQVKYIHGLVATNLVADTCGGIFNGVDVFDAALSNMCSRNDQSTTASGAYSFCIQVGHTYCERITISNVNIQMATDANPMAIIAHKTTLSNIQIISNRTGTNTAAGYDLRLLGTDMVADAVTIQNLGTSYYRGVVIGLPGYTTGNVTVSNLSCQKVRQIADFDASVTGTNTLDYSPGAMRDILTSAGTTLVGQTSGTAAFTLARREWAVTTTISGGATGTPRLALETTSLLSVTDTTAFTIAAPVGTPKAGMTHSIVIVNSSGGALGTITWNGVYTLRSGFVPPANGLATRVNLIYIGSAWVELATSAAAHT